MNQPSKDETLMQMAHSKKDKTPEARDFLSSPSYWELFDAITIDSLTTLTAVQKFSYLKTTLEGEPSTRIVNLEMTAANYNSAIEISKDRYGDKQFIIEAHKRQLPKLDPKREGYNLLEADFDNLELDIRGLEARNKKKEDV